MRYFTAQLAEPGRDEKLEVDVPCRQFIAVIKGVEKRLQAIGKFKFGDDTLRRIKPEFEDTADTSGVHILDRYPDDLGQLVYELYLPEQMENIQDRAIQAISLWSCFPQDKIICSVTITVEKLFSSAYEYLARKAREKNWPEDGNIKHFSIFLRGSGPLFVPSSHKSRTLSLLVEAGKESGGTDTGAEKLIHSLFELSRNVDSLLLILGDEKKVINRVEGLDATGKGLDFTSEKRPWKDLSAEMKGFRQRGDQRIFISLAVLKQLKLDVAGAIETAKQNRLKEIGGFLLGEVLEDEGETWINITDVLTSKIAGKKYFTNYLMLEDPDRMKENFRQLLERFPGKCVVGWYHAPLNEMVISVGLENQNPGENVTYAISMQSDPVDMDIHHMFFYQPWQVYLDFNPRSGVLTFYQWKKDEIRQCQGYYVY